MAWASGRASSKSRSSELLGKASASAGRERPRKFNVSMSTLTKSDRRVALDERSATTIPPFPGILPPLRTNLAIGKRRAHRPLRQYREDEPSPLLKALAAAKTVQNFSTLRIAEERSRILFWPCGAGIRACRQYPHGPSQGGFDDHR